MAGSSTAELRLRLRRRGRPTSTTSWRRRPTPDSGAVPGAVAAGGARGVPRATRAQRHLIAEAGGRARRLRAAAPAPGGPRGRAAPARGDRAGPAATAAPLLRARQGRAAFEEHGAHRLWLDVKPHNERARALYRTRGLRRGGRPARRAARARRPLRGRSSSCRCCGRSGRRERRPPSTTTSPRPTRTSRPSGSSHVLGTVPEFVPVRIGGAGRLPLRRGGGDLPRRRRAPRGRATG